MGTRKERNDPGPLRPPSATRGKNKSEVKELARLEKIVKRGKTQDTAVRALIINSMRGDPNASEMLYAIFVHYVNSSDYLRLLQDWRVLEFVAHRIGVLLHRGGDPRKALGLSRSRGAQTKTFSKGFAAAAELKNQLKSGETPSNDQKEWLSNKYDGVSVREIERAYKKYFKPNEKDQKTRRQ